MCGTSSTSNYNDYKGSVLTFGANFIKEGVVFTKNIYKSAFL